MRDALEGPPGDSALSSYESLCFLKVQIAGYLKKM